MAEELREALVPMSGPERAELVTRIIAGSDMVFGVWPDAGSDDGVGIAIIKGTDLMPPLVGFETENEVALAALPCVSQEVAIAAREALAAYQAEPPDEEAISARAALSISEVARLSWVKTGAARVASPVS
jgi:hypothetical protein